MSLLKIKQELESLRDPQKPAILARFFKTGKGEYGEGDIFLGATTPQLRTITKKYSNLTSKEIEKLLHNKIHEYRSTALMILNKKYQTVDPKGKEEIFNLYLKNTRHINNWDLVDISAPNIIGDYLLTNPQKRTILYQLAKSDDLWERRISIMSTLTFIRNYQYDDTFRISEILLNDKHDLIHKAVGWMLREIGKQDPETEEQFLRLFHKTMPRTMLRYAIEKFDEKRRNFYLGR